MAWMVVVADQVREVLTAEVPIRVAVPAVAMVAARV
jgi:hypothetical protein